MAFKMKGYSYPGKAPIKKTTSSSTPLPRIKGGRDDLQAQERRIRDKMQRDAGKMERKATRKQRRADALEDKGRGRRAYRKTKKAEGLMDAAETKRFREQDMYKKGLARDYGYTPEEIAEDVAFDYDPEGRRFGLTKGTRFLGKDRGRRDVSRGTFDEAAHEAAYADYEKENPITKKEPSKKLTVISKEKRQKTKAKIKKAAETVKKGVREIIPTKESGKRGLKRKALRAKIEKIPEKVRARAAEQEDVRLAKGKKRHDRIIKEDSYRGKQLRANRLKNYRKSGGRDAKKEGLRELDFVAEGPEKNRGRISRKVRKYMDSIKVEKRT